MASAALGRAQAAVADGHGADSVAFMSAARPLAEALGTMQVHAATFRAIFAVLRRKEHTTDREAWEAHGAAARTYQKWKSLIEPLETETTVNNFLGEEVVAMVACAVRASDFAGPMTTMAAAPEYFDGLVTFVARKPPTFLIVDDNIFVRRKLLPRKNWKPGVRIAGTKVASNNDRNPWTAVSITSVGLGAQPPPMSSRTSSGGGGGRSSQVASAAPAGRRGRSNPQSYGHAAVMQAEDPMPAANEPMGNPLWRGMYRVRGRTGSAAAAGTPEEPRLQRALQDYTAEGKRSYYKQLNRQLRNLQGSRIEKRSLLYKRVADLTMAIRLLWSPSGPEVVYRGVRADDCDVAEYEQARNAGSWIRWFTFSSTSIDRRISETFAGAGGTIFIIRRDPTHAAAADVSGCSSFPAEREVLMLPEQAFRVLAVRHVPGHRTEVELQEIPRFPADGEL